jgi:hypothetical protein
MMLNAIRRYLVPERYTCKTSLGGGDLQNASSLEVDDPFLLKHE